MSNFSQSLGAQQQQALIHRIRDEFGSMNRATANLHNAVKQLSEDLYSSDTHFILELIQNAEDNEYPPGRVPTLTIQLLSQDPTGTPGSDQALLLTNNESGFQEKDVEAICSIGKSTKAKREGYIGEKGIGFKSVFVVSDRPHVFSNDFNFRFDSSPDPISGLGYIVPYWVDYAPEIVAQHQESTCLLLPLKPRAKEIIVSQLQFIAPETILFLHKLKAITINLSEDDAVKVELDGSQWPVVRLVDHNDTSPRDYWLFSYEYEVPEEVDEPKRAGIKTRVVDLAFPLEMVDRKGTVYAFLPTEVDSGLPFIVNSDFLLDTAREQIRVDRDWNKWLRDCIANAFVESFDSMLADKERKTLAYSFIPLRKNVKSPFFTDTVSSILDELQLREVVITSDRRVLRPEEVRSTTKTIRGLLTSEGKPSQLHDTPLIAASIERYREQLHAIGVKELSIAEIINCLKDSSWLQKQSLEWFVELYQYLSEQGAPEDDLLYPLKLIVLTDGSLVSAAERTVYFNPEGLPHDLLGHLERSYDLHVGFLHPDLYTLIAIDEDLCDWLSRGLGVKEFSHEDYSVDLAKALGRCGRNVAPVDLVRISAYISDHLQDFDTSTKEEVKRHLPVLLTGDQVEVPQGWSKENPLVMPAALKTETGWQDVFADPSDRAHMKVLSDSYLAGLVPDDPQMNRWHTFFAWLGASDVPQPCKVKRDLGAGNPNSVEKRIEESLGRSFGGWHGFGTSSDFRAPSWLLHASDPKANGIDLKRHSPSLLKWLEATFRATTYGEPDFVQAMGYGRYRQKNRSAQEPSSFTVALKESAWFPSTRGHLPPGQVFSDKAELRELFGDTVPYGKVPVSDRVASYLGLHQSATVDDILNFLRKLSSKPAEQVNPMLLHKIYVFMRERWRSELRAAFESTPLIRVQQPTPKWVTSRQAIWTDLQGVFGDAYVYLEGQYPENMKDFFVEHLGIPVDLEPKQYADAWLNLIERRDLTTRQIEKALIPIYGELNAISNRDDRPDWWPAFCQRARVWTASQRFESPHLVFIPDDGNLKDLFHDTEYAWWPPRDSLLKFTPLYQSLGVESLSKHVVAAANVGPATEGVTAERHLTYGLKWATYHYLCNEMYEQYDEDALDDFVRTSECVVEALAVQYRLGTKIFSDEDVGAYWDRTDRRLYIRKNADLSRLEIDIPIIVARQLSISESKSLEDFVGRLLGASIAKASAIIKRHNWNLSEEQKQWLSEEIEPPPVDTPDNVGVVESSSTGENTLGTKHSAAPSTNNEVKEPSGGHDDLMPTTVGPTPREGLAQSGQVQDSPLLLHNTTTDPNTTAGDSLADDRQIRSETGTLNPQQTSAISAKTSVETVVNILRRQASAVPRPRLVSYVGNGNVDDQIDNGGTDPHERMEIAAAGIRIAKWYEQSQHRYPEELDHYHPGWDIDSYEAEGTGEIGDPGRSCRLARHIEVKAKKGRWDALGVGLTSRELQEAFSSTTHGVPYYLYVVECALDPSGCRLFIIENPASQITEFRLDEGWKQTSDVVTVPLKVFILPPDSSPWL